jgi:hypothetical protein
MLLKAQVTMPLTVATTLGISRDTSIVDTNSQPVIIG